MCYHFSMEKYQKFKIDNTSSLKKPTVYFFLKENNFSEHFIRQLRKNEKSFKVNGTFCAINNPLQNGDLLEILKSPQSASQIPPSDKEIEILYEDDDYLVVNKPHLLACIPTRSHYQDNLGGRIMNYMLKKDADFVLRIVNRLDKDTAGIVIVAKSVTAYNNLKRVDKTYYALCRGKFEQKIFTIDSPILTITKDGINEIKRIVSSDGKRAVTHIFVEKEYQTLSLVRVKLETGRTHQIRVHLSSIGHSLLGDHIYSPILEEERHTFLLLKEVEFTNPQTNAKISISVPFPDEWNSYFEG